MVSGENRVIIAKYRNSIQSEDASCPKLERRRHMSGSEAAQSGEEDIPDTDDADLLRAGDRGRAEAHAADDAGRAQTQIEGGVTADGPRVMTMDDARRTDIVNALLDLSSVKDVRFSVSRIFWDGFPFFSSLPERVYGTILQWLNKDQLRVRVEWDDEAVEPLSIRDLLAANMKLEPYRDNRPPPRPKRRRGVTTTAACAQVQGANGTVNDEVAQENAARVSLTYRRGGRAYAVEWTSVQPEGIIHDARTEERWRPRINRDKLEYKTPFLMWLNVALPMNFMQKMFGQDGFMNQRLSGKDNSAFHRRTTVGEGIALLGYMLAIANHPGRPVKQMWQEKPRPEAKEILPPAALGRFGISENRFERLMHLLGMMYSVCEAELDESDPWRYCNLPIDMHNAHWKEVYMASWLLAPDESMSPFVPACEGDGPADIPFLSYVPRKPKPLGAELKDVADGESGAILFFELALKYKRQRGSPQVVPPFAEQPGVDTMEAQCLRLTQAWHHTGRAVGADAHFVSVASCEAMREKGLYPFGVVKQANSGYPMATIESLVGPESGDWAVMKTELPNADRALLYAVAHRRGGVIHTFLSTHGSTRRGRDQKSDHASGGDNHCGPPRKAPRILNDWTQAQPHIDKQNRWRQFELGIEERFRTKSFPFRLFTTVIAGTSITNAYCLYQYHVNAEEHQSFSEFVNEVAYDAMTNQWDEDHATQSSSGTNNSFQSPLNSASLPSSASAMARRENKECHVAVPIRSIYGWKGKRQQKCSHCSSFVSYCCYACSSASCLVVIHPPEATFGGVSKKYNCLTKHKRNPDASKRTTASQSRSVAAKRRRNA